MSQEAFPQFNQQTRWDSEADIVLKGHEFETLMNLVSIFRPLVHAGDQIMQRQIQQGKVEVVYTDAAGNVVDPQLVQQAITAAQERLKTAAQPSQN